MNKRVFDRLAVVVFGIVFSTLGLGFSAFAQANVTQYHNHITRDGFYVDPNFTISTAAALTRDTNFNGTITGNVRAQPLYISSVSSGPAMVIVVTESDTVYALNATNGSVIWKDTVGTSVTRGLDCMDSINPMGITGTPVVDLPSRSLFFSAISTPNNGTTIQHFIYSLNVDTGATNSGWPVNVGSVVAYGGTAFAPNAQTQLNALAALNGYVYVTYCGCGDAGTYHGWIVGIEMDNPANVLSWAVGSRGGGSWGVGGIASDDGTNLFIGTGNTYNPSSWSGGEAIIRFQPGPIFSGLTNDYWVPTNWLALDTADLDIGSSGPLIMDVPNATPSQLIVALGKDGDGYLLNRTNLGGICAPLAQEHLSQCNIDQAAATYATTLGSYFVCNVSTVSTNTANETQFVAVRISATIPPTMSTIWTNNEGGRGSPFVTFSDGTNDIIVWGIGASGGDGKLRGFNPDTGAAIYSGGGSSEVTSGVQKWNTGIVANGRIYVAGNGKVYAFKPAALPNTVAFSLSASPASQLVGTQGTNVNYTISVTDSNGFSGSVSLSVASGLPTNANASFNPNPVTGAGNSTLTVTTTNGMAPGSYALTIAGIGDGQTNTTANDTIDLVVVPNPAMPYIGGITLVGTNLIISGTNGPTNGMYYVLTSTNVALPLIDWWRIGTNPFDGSGNFIFTNPVGSNAASFYLLELP